MAQNITLLNKTGSQGCCEFCGKSLRRDLQTVTHVLQFEQCSELQESRSSYILVQLATYADIYMGQSHGSKW